MFNADTWQSHSAYRINFKNAKAHFSGTWRGELAGPYSEVRKKLMSMNLDPLADFVQSLYSRTGRPAKNQAQILRSIVTFVLLLNQTSARLSLTSWVNEVLPYNPVLIALVGCRSMEDLPPLGSYYDLMNRFWGAERERYSRSKLFPAGKNCKLKKEIGPDGKQVDADPGKYKANDLKNMILSGKDLGNNQDATLQKIFHTIAVFPSIQRGLIPSECLTLSGDGTAVAVHASPFGSRQKGCEKPNECRYHLNCPRHYSDPDADWGYDSHEKHHYFGRTLYMICSHSSEYKVDLPILSKFMSARRHDSIIFFYAVDELGKNMPTVSPTNFCLDSAHDNIATYELLNHWDINALIDINGRSMTTPGLPEDITLNKKAHPICMAGREMSNWGYDKNKEAVKYRCPIKTSGHGSCPFMEKCSKSNYGRTVYINPNRDLRFHPRIARDSTEYKRIYNDRTSCERVNNRVLNDYYLQNMKIRGDDHYSFWTMIICVCLHLDAWYKANK